MRRKAGVLGDSIGDGRVETTIANVKLVRGDRGILVAREQRWTPA
jgi:hypothetical protein